MDKTLNFIKICAVTTGIAVGDLLGGFDMFIRILLIMIALDYITGVLKAIYTKTLDSSIGFKGIIKKVTALIMVVVAVQIDCAVGTEQALRVGTIFFFIANEGISILENASAMDMPIPSQIKNALNKFKGDEK